MYFVGQYKDLQNLSHVKEKNSNPKKIAIENRVIAIYKIVDVW